MKNLNYFFAPVFLIGISGCASNGQPDHQLSLAQVKANETETGLLIKNSPAPDIKPEQVAPTGGVKDLPELKSPVRKIDDSLTPPDGMTTIEPRDEEFHDPLQTDPPRIQTGRYTSVKLEPTLAQQHILQVPIKVTIPEEIQTVGQTVRYLLERSGYTLAHPARHEKVAVLLLDKPLPEIHRNLGPMTLESALLTLTAPAFTIKTDPVTRTVTYTLSSHYQPENLNAH